MGQSHNVMTAVVLIKNINVLGVFVANLNDFSHEFLNGLRGDILLIKF
jgi:hypothetical protein